MNNNARVDADDDPALQNFIPYGEYFVTASIGTPAQDVELVLDTGSSDIWMFSPAACNDVGCQGGSCKLGCALMGLGGDGQGQELIMHSHSQRSELINTQSRRWWNGCIPDSVSDAKL